MSQWEFTASIDDDGDLFLEWYKDKGNVVTIGFDKDKYIYWAALVDSVAHSGSTKSDGTES